MFVNFAFLTHCCVFGSSFDDSVILRRHSSTNLLIISAVKFEAIFVLDDLLLEWLYGLFKFNGSFFVILSLLIYFGESIMEHAVPLLQVIIFFSMGLVDFCNLLLKVFVHLFELNHPILVLNLPLRAWCTSDTAVLGPSRFFSLWKSHLSYAFLSTVVVVWEASSARVPLQRQIWASTTTDRPL